MFSFFARVVFGISVLGLFFGLSSWVHADETQLSQVRGRVEIQRRTTFVPLAFCNGAQCTRSQPYWVMTLTSSDGTVYEFDQNFSYGSNIAPLGVQVSGVVLHSGNEVLLEGQTEILTNHFGVIKGVNWVKLVD